MIKKLFGCMDRKYIKYTVATPLTMLLEVSMEVALPFLIQLLIDNGINTRNVGYVMAVGGIMVLCSMLSLVGGTLSGRFAAVAGAGFAKGVRQKMFYRIQDFSFPNIDKFSTASLLTRMTTDVMWVQQSFVTIIRMLVRAPLMMIFGIIMALSINAELSIVFVIALPIMVVLFTLISSKTMRYFKKMFEQYDSMNASVQEDLIGIRVVKSFVRKEFEDQKFVSAATLLQAAQKKAEKMILIMMPVMQLIMYAALLAVLWFGGSLIIEGDMTTGQLVSFISYIMQILMSILMVAFSFVTLILSRASGRRICEVLDEHPSVTDENADPNLTVPNGAVCFKDVCFSYSDQADNLTLSNINLDIKPGEVVGVIGGTGSAKTTLVQLIPRLYDIYSGSLSVGGHDVHDYTLKNLRSAVSMVLQKNVLFSGTIRDNLRWGDPNATDEEITAACEAAQADKFIREFPEGYDTVLGQGGVNVSGGQKQRLCIARALLAKPKVLILDDSTSAVDTATDAKIREAFRTSLPETTKIIIAQRVASIQDADKIVVLEDGKINAVGTHEELLASNPIYQEVYHSQQKGVA